MKTSSNRQPFDVIGVVWLVVGTLLAGGLLASAIPQNSQELDRDTRIADAEVESVSFKPIEEIRVGHRVVTDLSRRVRAIATDDDAIPTWYGNAIHPAQWQQVDLTLIRSDGSPMDVVLLRPKTWVAENDVAPGRSVPISLPEMRQEGLAQIHRVSECPSIDPGDGRVVTGTFASTVDSIVEVHLNQAGQPILCTAEHPFYRSSDHSFVAACELRNGDRVRHLSGKATVQRIVPRRGTYRVYNLEVHGDHVYRVSRLGVLVHNLWVTGYRAVSADELADIKATGGFRPKPDGSSLNPKWFSESPAGAKTYV